MDPGSPVPDDLAQRVARLEAQVAWLLQQAQGTPAPAPRRQPAPPPAPARRVSPVAWIAGAGAALFLVGAVFFFRWAVLQGWMGPFFRVLLGLLAGGILSAYAGRQLLGGGPRLGTALLLAGLGTLQFSFRAGTLTYGLFDPALGLAATVALTLLAGGLAARARRGGALVVALASGLAAPLAFSQGGHHEVALAVYLACLAGAALAVPYLGRAGAAWRGARWTLGIGTWLLLLPACTEVLRAEASWLALLLLVHLALAGAWAWLPGVRERPATPVLLWLVASLLATLGGALVWRRLGWMPEGFAAPLVAAAAWNLGLVRPLRLRMGGPRADLGLLALAVGHLALAVPVALAWRWVGPAWGAFAVALAWAARRSGRAGTQEREARGLGWLAAGLALLATLRWAVHGLGGAFEPWAPGLPFLRAAFAEGALAATAWALLAGTRDRLTRLLGWVGLQATANVTLAVEAGRLVHLGRPGGPSFRPEGRGPSVAMTLVWALSGAFQWMQGLAREGEVRRALLAAGYLWMGLASGKLLLLDLATASTPLRALAFLGVGAIGMAAAVLARRGRPGEGA